MKQLREEAVEKSMNKKKEMKRRYDEDVKERKLFEVGDLVLMKDHIHNNKFANKLLGPFEVVARPSSQSYTLKLPTSLKGLHPVFHVSQLEPHHPNLAMKSPMGQV